MGMGARGSFQGLSTGSRHNAWSSSPAPTDVFQKSNPTVMGEAISGTKGRFGVPRHGGQF